MIQCRELTKTFESNQALKAVTFDITDGSIYGLIGSNGSGKSTLLRLISGVYKNDSGTITVDGKNPYNNTKIKSQVAFLGDTPYFLPQSSIKDMADFYSKMYSSFDYSVYKRLIEVFPIDYKARISSMSKGMQRQAALILAMSTSPKYLLLDEAFDGLDVVMRKVLKSILIDGVENRGMTTIIASHNLRELEDLCDHVGLIHQGKIIFNDQIDKLKGKLHKVQVAFEHVPEMSVFNELNILKVERTGSLLQIIVRGEEQQIMKYIKRLSPVFCECIEPSLEEMFIYELEVTGYDVKNIIG